MSKWYYNLVHPAAVKEKCKLREKLFYDLHAAPGPLEKSDSFQGQKKKVMSEEWLESCKIIRGEMPEEEEAARNEEGVGRSA